MPYSFKLTPGNKSINILYLNFISLLHCPLDLNLIGSIIY